MSTLNLKRFARAGTLKKIDFDNLMGLLHAHAAYFNGRGVALDGNALGEMAFIKTGGFSTSRDNWAYAALGGDQRPTLLELTAGEHRLRLGCTSGGLGLDYIVLSRE